MPIPPGLTGTSVARLCVACTSSTLRSDWSIPKASSMNQIVARRRPQSASCQSTTFRSQRVGVRTIVNAWPTRSLNSATCALTQIISAISPNTTASRTSSPIRSCSKSQRKSKLGSEGSRSMLGKTPCVSAQANSTTAHAMSTIASTALELTSVV